ncbi:toll/interleukin-1 receptor domain-containing protein [Nocardiopsis sp. CNS-639]|uniref:toll/interleukin-1 receptor domain-containing protein n=1 Tax=Nocardiopsis sp. CNS-639 TaxID=1169153 RepID=UPI0003820B8C|nr:toll/interleukin-1 receptor domain-containing protein [Nocardiopsis sp. CNS-639]
MPGCFINYRTGDGEHVATLIDRELKQRFGPDEVFRASRSIDAGQDYVHALDAAVRRCEVLVAIIGPAWLDSPHRSGGDGRALDDPDDWTRREIATALSLGTPVIPVLFDGAARLRPADLPEDMRGLARCQNRRLHHRSAESDLVDIIEAVEVAVPRLGEADETSEDASRQPAGSGVFNTAHDVSGGTVSQAGEFHGINGISGRTGDVAFGNSGPVNTGAGSQYNGSTVHNGTGDQIGVHRFLGHRDRGESR